MPGRYTVVEIICIVMLQAAGSKNSPFLGFVDGAFVMADTVLSAWADSTQELDEILERHSLLSVQDAVLNVLGPLTRALDAAEHDSMQASSSDVRYRELQEHAEQLAHKLSEAQHALAAQKLDNMSVSEAVNYSKKVCCIHSRAEQIFGAFAGMRWALLS
jgi:hypothetical protein